MDQALNLRIIFEKPECNCRDHEFTNGKCKHIFAVEYTIELYLKRKAGRN